MQRAQKKLPLTFFCVLFKWFQAGLCKYSQTLEIWRKLNTRHTMIVFLNYILFSQESARRIAKISEEAKMDIDVDEYIDSFKPQMMDVVYSWATGCTFADICKMTDVFEGKATMY